MINVIEDKKKLCITALKINQPVGEFYVGVVKSDDLYDIARFDIRRITQREGIDEFLGIQREVSPRRLKELKQYIRTKDATFPTSIIIAVDERCAQFNPVKGSDVVGELVLSNYVDDPNPDNHILYRDIAKIIDGQHRVKTFEEKYPHPFELNVSIFVGADVATQAEIFATVNQAQTKVNPSLVYDLFALARYRSPEKTAHEITVLLDRRNDSPFFRRIKRLGVATHGRVGETLSQATVVRGILSHITKSAMIDREIGKREQTWQYSRGDEYRFVFRYHFANGQDEIIFLNIFNYFDAVKQVWPTAWANSGLGNVLPRTNGYLAFMRFIRLVILDYSVTPCSVPKEYFVKVMARIRETLQDDDFNTKRFPPGTSGETNLYNDLCELSGLSEPVRR